MPRVFLELSYHGGAYHGWQTQAAGVATVQATLEGALSRMLGRQHLVHGCGRTDAGVHASRYFAHLDLSEVPDFDPLQRINYLLPADISVRYWTPVPDGAHAQRDATSRTYHYLVSTRREALRAGRAGRYDDCAIDLEAMQTAVAAFAKTRDFAAFCRRPHQYTHTGCRVDACALDLDVAPSLHRFRITADRFLQNMVRILVARAIDVGTGRLTLAEVEDAIASGIAPRRLEPAYAQGLYLADVTYPERFGLAR